MKTEKLEQIIEVLRSVNPRQAKKLEKLINEYYATMPVANTQIKNKIQNYVYAILTSCLDKDSRIRLFSLAADISETCYTIEKGSRKGWYINNKGARRYEVSDDKVTTACMIPRIYKHGFVVQQTPITCEKDRQNKVEEIDFVNDHAYQLDFLSTLMDRKAELLTYKYQTKNARIPRVLTDLMIDFLGMARLSEEDKKEYAPEPEKRMYF